MGALMFCSILSLLLIATTTTSDQLYDYGQLQGDLNAAAVVAEKELQAIRREVSDFVLTTTDEMISHAADQLDATGSDPRAPMIGACTLYPTNWLNFYTREMNTHLADAQALVNSLKFVLLRGLVNQPMISEPQVTFAKVQTDVDDVVASWTAEKTALAGQVADFKAKADQLVADMKMCISIIEE